MQSHAIHFTTLRCELGWLLVARTARGVCNLRFGDAPEELEAGLRAEFPFAEVVGSEERLASCVAALRRYLAGRSRGLDLPLDVRGSQFQRRVWDAIRAIPYGETRSYADLARAIGRPRAFRAVAGACGANPVALGIPCHRVVGSGGALGGYRYGRERKGALLGLEGREESDKSLFFARLAGWRAPRPRNRALRSRRAAGRPDAASSTPPSSP
jgi:AraC family transcriptional regulator of adaptative response/methylated-DNA-[protein]-cysteine methyltransferase